MRFRAPSSMLFLLLALPLLFLLFIMFFVGAISEVFQVLGFPPWAAVMLLFGVLLGSFVNIPVWQVAGQREHVSYDTSRFPFRPVKHVSEGTTTINLNLGGAVIPIGVSLFLLARLPTALYPHLLAATVVVAAVCYKLARPVRGTGIAMPALIPPLLASLLAILLAPPGQAAVVAFVAGVIGVLVGADLLNLPRLGNIGARAASIGGAGTFDGIFLTGILSVALVAIL
ncbi:MAG: DUF1614 domain-containing protein [Thermoplasmatota archaeon]